MKTIKEIFIISYRPWKTNTRLFLNMYLFYEICALFWICICPTIRHSLNYSDLLTVNSLYNFILWRSQFVYSKMYILYSWIRTFLPLRWVPFWLLTLEHRNSPQRFSAKKVFQKTSQNLPENICSGVSFLIKFQSWDNCIVFGGGSS